VTAASATADTFAEHCSVRSASNFTHQDDFLHA